MALDEHRVYKLRLVFAGTRAHAGRTTFRRISGAGARGKSKPSRARAEKNGAGRPARRARGSARGHAPRGALKAIRRDGGKTRRGKGAGAALVDAA